MPFLPTTPSFKLSGKRAFVSGSGRGIGMAAAAALSQAGADVTICARTLYDIEAVAQAIKGSGGDVRPVVLDVTDTRRLSEILHSLGPFDILINNAGISRPCLLEDVREGDFDETFALNVRAALFAIRTVAGDLAAAGKGGSIINVSSTLGHVGMEGRAIYSASKFALEGMTRSLAIELGRYGIRVNTICPTIIETELTATMRADPTYVAKALDKIKLGRLGTLEDVMGAFVFLASDASALITGTSLMIDGGWTAE